MQLAEHARTKTHLTLANPRNDEECHSVHVADGPIGEQSAGAQLSKLFPVKSCSPCDEVLPGRMGMAGEDDRIVKDGWPVRNGYSLVP